MKFSWGERALLTGNTKKIGGIPLFTSSTRKQRLEGLGAVAEPANKKEKKKEQGIKKPGPKKCYLTTHTDRGEPTPLQHPRRPQTLSTRILMLFDTPPLAVFSLLTNSLNFITTSTYQSRHVGDLMRSY